jgi:hypothetical protein
MDAAAELAVKQFIAMNRPRVRVRFVYWDDPSGVGNPINGPAIHYSLVNEGGSSAHVVSCTVMHWLAETGQHLPSVPPHLTRPVDDAPFTLKPGEIRVMYCDTPKPELRRLMLSSPREAGGPGFAQQRRFWVTGLVIYGDESGGMYHKGFGRQYNPANRRFEAIDDPDYEYGD